MYPKSELKKAVARLIHTSVDDCRASVRLFDRKDLDVLVAALWMSIRLKHTTRARIIRTAIRRIAPTHPVLEATR